jgi:hypothetical protein
MSDDIIGNSFENPFDNRITALESVDSEHRPNLDSDMNQQSELLHKNTKPKDPSTATGLRHRGIKFLKNQIARVYEYRHAADDEINRDATMKRRWKLVRTIFFLFGLFVLAYLVHAFDMRVTLSKLIQTQISVDGQSHPGGRNVGVEKVILSSWYDSMTDDQLKAIVLPPYINESDYVKRSNSCRHDALFIERIFDDTERESLRENARYFPVLPHVSKILYYHYQQEQDARTKTFVSLNVVQDVFEYVLKSQNSITQSDVLCTFMFGGWPQEFGDIPCLCGIPDMQTKLKIIGTNMMMINPYITVIFNSTITIEEDDLMFNDRLNSAPVSRIKKIPNIVQASFETIKSPVSIEYRRSNKITNTFDMIHNVERSFAPISFDHREVVTVTPQHINIFVCVQNLLDIFKNATNAAY